jgi:hypothetical protein
VTTAPGTDWPPGSLTAPRSAPVVEDCAHKQEDRPAKATIKKLAYRKKPSRLIFQGSCDEER